MRNAYSAGVLSPVRERERERERKREREKEGERTALLFF
jgi:hypothetical protein